MLIRRLEQADWPRVSEIFSEGIATRMATFETAVPDWADWDRDHVADPRLVAVSSGLIVGWAALSRVSSRQAYRGVAEVSVYVGIYHRGQGVGRALLDRLVVEAGRAGFWTLQAALFPENTASVRLHRACGFRTVGRRKRIGRLDGEWRDTLLLERRRTENGD